MNRVVTRLIAFKRMHRRLFRYKGECNAALKWFLAGIKLDNQWSLAKPKQFKDYKRLQQKPRNQRKLAPIYDASDLD